MKRINIFLRIIAAVLLGVIIVNCNSLKEELDNTETMGDAITLSTTLALNTRALTETGVKTFAAGDQIAVVYINTSDVTVVTTSSPLVAGDLSADSKKATFTVTLTSPKASAAVKYIYPASMAKADGTVNYNALNVQDGSLATLASDLDCCTFDGFLTAGAELPSSVTLENQLAITKFTIQNSGDITNTITAFNISDGTNLYSVTPTSLDEIWIAIKPVSSDKTMVFTATDGTDLYVKSVTSKTLSASNLYPINLTMTKSVPTIGHFLNKDGSITSTKQDSGTNESFAVIAYVGSVAHYFEKFIAIALDDVSSSTLSLANARYYTGTYASNHPIMIGGSFFNTNAIGTNFYDQVSRDTSKPSNTRVDPVVKGWRMPCVTDLRYVFQGFGGPSATSPVGVQDSQYYGSGSTLLNAINTACGNSNLRSSWYYLSSSGEMYALWNFRFDYGQFRDYPANGFYTRAVFAY
jgi:hypothetical protein